MFENLLENIQVFMFSVRCQPTPFTGISCIQMTVNERKKNLTYRFKLILISFEFRYG